jgi:hypothetical protein
MKNRGNEARSETALREAAEQVAVAALSFLASEPDRLSRFLSLSGLGPQNLRAAAADPAFLSSVLDYLLADEPLLLAFAADQGQAPESVATARRALGGLSPEPP